jgi:hypothetical protein
MQSIACLLLMLALTGCITFYERDEPGIYPMHLGFNGQQYFVGFKHAFDLPVSRIGK